VTVGDGPSSTSCQSAPIGTPLERDSWREINWLRVIGGGVLF
jgi:hypothetical protein